MRDLSTGMPWRAPSRRSDTDAYVAVDWDNGRYVGPFLLCENVLFPNRKFGTQGGTNGTPPSAGIVLFGSFPTISRSLRLPGGLGLQGCSEPRLK